MYCGNLYLYGRGRNALMKSMDMGMLVNFLGLMLTLGAMLLTINILRIWKHREKDGIFLFFLGFLFMAIGFAWDFSAFQYTGPLSDQTVFAIGAALLFGGSYKLFTFVYP